jgi:flagellum-specific ATP synthase
MDLRSYQSNLSDNVLYKERGRVVRTMGLVFEAILPGASVGSLCEVHLNGYVENGETCLSEVIGFSGDKVVLMPFEEMAGINNKSEVVLKQKSAKFSVGNALLGRVIDPSGKPIDRGGPLFKVGADWETRSIYAKPVSPMLREVIREPLELGVRAIDGTLTCGKGQRVGIMAGSGVGKSVLMGMVARNTSADVNVIALVGERGREVREFIEHDLGPEGLARSILIVATSDSSALLRMRAAHVALTIAEYFRDQEKDVLLLMDSLTRFSMAQREIGLSMGEPPASKGYTPSVFAALPRLLERAGTGEGKGSITGLFTVLVEGDDMDDPIGDAARSILDGHIVLSRGLAQRNHFPAIDILQSVSRVMGSVITSEHKQWAFQLREALAIYKENEDLINVGAYVSGNSPKLDAAVVIIDRINSFLMQQVNEKSSLNETLARMHGIIRAAQADASGFKRPPVR